MDDGALEVLDDLEDVRERAHALLEPQDEGGALHGVLGLLILGQGVLQEHLLLGEAGVCGQGEDVERERVGESAIAQLCEAFERGCD